ncbi:MAG: hypothetical protein JJU44_01300 [Planctomycetes bacterium]|nr:hypothetical protein [Planctomycetota bacterium]
MSRRTVYRIGETVHLTALAVWSGALFGAGVAAAVAFPTMRDLAPTLGAYPGYDGEHWMLAAGRVAARVFLVTDMVQFVCAFLAIGGFVLAVIAGSKAKSWLQFFRALALGVAFLLASFHLLIQGPSMDRDLRAYWDAAAAGNNEAAQTHQQAFARQHPNASRVMTGTFIATLGALGLGAWSLAGRAAARDGEPL